MYYWHVNINRWIWELMLLEWTVAAYMCKYTSLLQVVPLSKLPCLTVVCAHLVGFIWKVECNPELPSIKLCTYFVWRCAGGSPQKVCRELLLVKDDSGKILSLQYLVCKCYLLGDAKPVLLATMHITGLSPTWQFMLISGFCFLLLFVRVSAWPFQYIFVPSTMSYRATRSRRL